RRHTRSKRDWSSDVCSSDLRNLIRLGEPRFDFRQTIAADALASDVRRSKRDVAQGGLRFGLDCRFTFRAAAPGCDHETGPAFHEIGRASCRERGEMSGVTWG